MPSNGAKMSGIQEITRQVLKKISPKREDYVKVEALTKLLEKKVASACAHENVSATVRVEGSVAKDTWLKDDVDIDIFMRLPTSISRKDLGDIGLRIARRAANNYKQMERFAEHPYLELIVEGYRVDIVPCFASEPGQWQSATDRTPYHTDYIKQRLNKNLHKDVRLLKKFMQGINVYGAEIKIGGFSGYSCELLIMKFGSFSETIQAFANYSQRLIVDIERFYENNQKDLRLLFSEPLLIIDPVDKARNVASAVRPEKLYTFVAAARAFLKNPNKNFFYPRKTTALSIASLKRQIKKRGSPILFLVIDQVEAVPDVLWGQLYKTKRALSKLIELNDYKLLRDAVWSDENTISIFIFELEQQNLPDIKTHLGPPIERQPECENFLAKHLSNTNVVSGPYIEDGRWKIQLPRKTIDVTSMLKQKLEDGGKNIGVAELISKSIQLKLMILVNEKISSQYRENEDFARFLTDFLDGKPSWLKTD